METVCIRECAIVCEDTWIYSGHCHIEVHRSTRAPSPSGIIEHLGCSLLARQRRDARIYCQDHVLSRPTLPTFLYLEGIYSEASLWVIQLWLKEKEESKLARRSGTFQQENMAAMQLTLESPILCRIG